MKKILLLVLLIGIVGCSQSEPVTTTCTYQEQPWDITHFYESEGDKLLSEEMSRTYSWLGYMSKESITSELQSLGKRYQDIPGLTYEYELSDSVASETMTIDYTIITIEDLSKLNLIEKAEGDVYVSLKQSLTNLKNDGFKCE